MKKSIVLILACCLWATLAAGSSYTVNFTGQITSVDDPSNLGGFTLGESFSGSFFVDTTVAPNPSYSTSTANVYYLYGEPNSFTMGSFTDNNQSYSLIINYFGPSTDQSYAYTVISGSVQNHVYATEFGLNLDAPSGGALSGLSDNQVINPALFSNQTFFIEGRDVAANNYQLLYWDDATLNSVTITGVPEPASLILLLSGLVGIGGLRRKRNA